jgi:4-aminobutyrate aminotransferase-like enzyme/Ser/Thr protein kinase RdoA (MazF antagonist)
LDPLSSKEKPRSGSVLEVKAPALACADAERIAAEVFGVSAEARPLYSERDQNFHLHARDGRELVLKVANPAEDPAVIDFQTSALLHIARTDPELPVPRVVATAGGASSCPIQGPDGRSSIARLLSFLPGQLLEHAPHDPGLLREVGVAAARLGRALRGFFHPAARHDLLWDLLQAPRLRERTRHIENAERRRLVDQTFEHFEAQVLPELCKMRAQVIHNDVSCRNTLVDLDGHREVVGVLDFGDLIHAPLVCDLAVPVAELMIDKPDPLAAAMEIVAGYHEVEPFREEELSVVFDLAATRLAMSVTIAAWRARDHPENIDYITADDEFHGTMLQWLRERGSGFAHACLRHACALPASRSALATRRWLEDNVESCCTILDLDLPAARKRALSPESGAGEEDGNWLAEAEVGIAAHGQEIACGGREAQRSRWSAEELCSVHLGVDLYVPAGASVRAPLAGVLHQVVSASTPESGTLVALEHRVQDELRFYTLYRGLAPESLQALQPGRSLRAGDRLGLVGDAGGSARPHLHFQIAADLLGLGASFPTTCEPSKHTAWESLSPDPNAILGIPSETFEAREGEAEHLLERRAKLLGPALELSYDRPLHVVRAQGARLIDASGRAYLDAYNNVPQVGHCHPAVVEALARQAATLNTNTRYLYESVLDYAERLTATMPGNLSVCSFVNSGSEANDLAWRLAKAYTGNDGAIVIREAYHGTTDAVHDLSPYQIENPAEVAPYVVTVPAPDGYRGPHRRGAPDLGERYAACLDDAIAALRERGQAPAAFYIDLGLSSSGLVVPPEGYLRAAFEKVRAAGGLCVADEVQSGFGRSGTHMWGFEVHGAVPDIVTLGKPIGNGHPLAAVVTTAEILRSLTDRSEFFSTFGGNPVACAVGLAVLDVLEREGLRENALRVGARLRAGLAELAERHPLIGDVRGTGLLIGVELVRDRTTLEPAAEEAHDLINRMRDDGVLVGIDGPHANVLKIRPPLVFSEADAEHFLEVLDRALSALRSSG